MSFKPPVGDATTIKKGIVQLAGDLGGTAASPTVPSLSTKLNTSQVGVANGVASLDANGIVPTAQLPAASSPVTSVATRTGDVVLTKADVGLSNVDNTSDANKPISSATQTAINGKANTTHTHAIADTTGLQAAIDSKAAVSHTHGAGDVTSGTFGYGLLPAGSTLTVAKAAGVWPARPTSRTDIIVQWKGADPSPSIVSSGTGGMMDNVDIRMITP